MTSAPAANPTSLSVAERMARLLGVVPWVVEQDGAHLDDISARFDYPREQLLEDLEQRLFFVGVHPFTPDTLIEVRISDGSSISSTRTGSRSPCGCRWRRRPAYWPRAAACST